MNYELTDKEFEILSCFWVSALDTNDPRQKLEAEEGLKKLAIASRRTTKELIEEHRH